MREGARVAQTVADPAALQPRTRGGNSIWLPFGRRLALLLLGMNIGSDRARSNSPGEAVRPAAGWIRRVLLSLLLLSWLEPAADADALVAEDDAWRYRKGWTEASTPDPTEWRGADSDDAGWEVGRGPFFYELGAGYTGNTELPDMNGGYSCLFLRRSFELVNPAAMATLTLDVRSDDGCVVWLNGQEVARVNMPAGEPTYSGLSNPAAGEPNIATIEIANAGSLLRAGRNVLSVQAFNAARSGSTDFLIAVTLSSVVDLTSPEVIETFPAPGAKARELTFIEVVFDEAVIGVDASDLLINGVPAASFEVFSPRNYGFRFPELTPGEVQVRWVSNHGITDVAPTPNPFSGGAWTYTLDPALGRANVVISEFLASNNSGIRDDFAERSDWIELLNLEAEAVELGGWFLTDDANEPTKWRFPSVTLPAGGYLLVWASERNLTAPAKPLHANFRLGADGEYLALFDPQTNVVSAFDPAFPPQGPDVSYGRAPGDAEIVGFFPSPTPGARNGTSGPGFAPSPEFSVPGGFYTTVPLTVTLRASSGVIRYTTDGTLPTASSTAYTAPLPLSASTVVQARVFEDGLLPGPVAIETYTLAGAGMTGFGSNLPLLVIHTSGRTIGQDARRPVAVSVFEPFRGRTTFARPPTAIVKGQMEGRGQSSAGFPKQSFNLELNDPYGNDVEVPLLGLPAESDWVLYAPYTDKPLIHNFLAYELHRQMGHWSPRCRFVELFLDVSGRLDYNSDYRGIYLLVEKIKVDNHRLDLARLSPTDAAEPEISGGYVIKKDKDSPGDRGFSTSGGGSFGGQYLKFHEPKPREITTAQQTWIRGYLNRFEAALYASNWLTRTGTNHYGAFIDVDSFVDNHWIVEFAKQIDGYRLSNYMHKDRGGKLKMSPIWDWNLSFGNADYLDGQNTAGWYYPLIAAGDHIWLRRLISGTPSGGGNQGDPDFNQRLADRWSELRTNILSATRVRARIDELATELDEAQVREFKRWPRLGQYVWPNPSIYVRPTNYAGVVNAMKTWVQGRYTWIDSQFLVPPNFSRAGGGISPGFPLHLSAGAGTIYYTTDGTDPRAPGGGVAPEARPYGSEVRLENNARVVARLRSVTRWSGPSAATFVVSQPPLVLTELMYRPRRLAVTDTNDPGEYEFIELRNTSPAPLDLRGFVFTDGIQFAFATGAVTRLDAGARVVVARNAQAFAQRYGASVALAGSFVGNLANEGEMLTLRGPHQETVFSFAYDPRWQPATDGLGFALVRAEVSSTGDLGDPEAWRTGRVPEGTPGEAEPDRPAILPILVNEVLSRPGGNAEDAIELYNPNDQPVEIGGWHLTDDRRTPKFHIPQGTVIPARGCRVFTADDFGAAGGGASGFGLSASGDEVYLLSGDGQGGLTGYVHGFEFGASPSGVSFGRLVTAAGEEHFVAQAELSLGRANLGPIVGPIILSEVMYHPPDVPANGARWDNTEDEYVELTNLGPTSVPLFDSQLPSETWQLREAVRFRFPTNQFIAAGERLLVVSFSPDADPAAANGFRAKHNLPATTRLLGPFDGKLANDHNRVELVRPEVVQADGTNAVIGSVLVDEVDFEDALPWPVGADGTGFSLQRRSEPDYGNDPQNWVAAAPTPGAPLAVASAPVLVREPEDRDARPGDSVLLTVLASDPGPLQYQWRFNGAALPGSHLPMLSIPSVQAANAGDYQVIVWNQHRAVVTRPARLRVGVPPEIVQHPASTQAIAGDRVSFSIVAAGGSPLAYQWRRDGSDIPGAVQASLVLSSVGIEDAGRYEVVVADDAGTITSQPATLAVLAPPSIAQSPLSLTAHAGGTFTLSVAVVPGASLPLTFTWSRDGVTIATHTRQGYVDFLTRDQVGFADAGAYRVAVSNATSPAGGVLSDVAQVQVVQVPDADGDGLPDAFEQQFGLRPDLAADATEDLDGDGASNLDEYRAGTDPADAESVFKLEVPRVDGQVVLRFHGHADRTYAVLASDQASDHEWTVVAAIPAASATPSPARIIEIADPTLALGAARYYRVVTPGVIAGNRRSP